MSERISIGVLRQWATTPGGFWRVGSDELLALVEAVEAAQRIGGAPGTWGYDYDVQAMTGLRDALARFDFSEPDAP